MELLFLLLAVPVAVMIGDALGDDDDSDDDAPPPPEPEPERFEGTEGDDLMVGTDSAEVIAALGGDDFINALAGNDTIDAGPGNDEGTGGDGDDDVYAQGGDDLFIGGAGDDRVFLGDGNDFSTPLVAPDLALDSGDDLTRGGTGDDRIIDFRGADTLYGDPGDDLLNAIDFFPEESASDELFGGYGSDLLGGDDGDTMTGGNGDDQFVSFVNETDDDPVTITDWQPGENVGLIWDGDTLGPAEQSDLTMEQDPDTGTVQLFVKGHCVAIVENATDLTLDDVGLFVDYSEAA